MIIFAIKKKLHTANGEMMLHVDCRFEQGKFIAVYGPSGAGKTSILRMLAGFMNPDEGYIRMDNESWFDSGKRIHVKPQHRKIGFVFQDYALFPHMNVRENISFALKKNESAEIVEELMHVTGLTGLAARNIQTLSGGQKQRVALARAIASKPSILLLDEPLSAIDQNMRVQLQHTLEEVHKRYKLTSILVSHNMEEIIRLSDFVIHLEEGQVRQISAPVSFFRDHNSAPEITGQVVSIEKNPDGSCTFILLNNRIIKIYSDNDGQQVEVGEKVGIVYKNDVAKIRKL